MDRQANTIDFQWLTFVILLMMYCTQAVHDWISASLFTLILLFYAGLLPKKVIVPSIQFLLWAEAAIKSPFSGFDPQVYQLDLHCMNGVMKGEVRPDTMLWGIVNVLSMIIMGRMICGQSEKDVKKWGPLMTQIMVYTLPMLLYLFNLMAINQGLKMAWAGLTCLQILHLFPIFTHLMCCMLTTYYFFVDSEIPHYQINISTQPMPQAQTKNIVSLCYFIMLILINVYSNPHPQYKQNPQKLRESSSQLKKVLQRKKLLQQHKTHRLRSQLIIGSTVLVCLVTTAPGNIFLLLAVFSNLPVYKVKRFSFLMGFGLLVSMLLEPTQLLYFIYGYSVILILGEDLKGNQMIQFDLYSYGFFLDFYRLYIMLSHVSFINFLIGLCRSSIIVMFALLVRIVCRYFSITNVFMGTNDNYGFTNSVFDLQALPDGVLWAYLLFLRLYSQHVTHSYKGSNITNILLQYPFLTKIEGCLVILRVFNWISYIAFSMLILSRHPSLFVLTHIVFLLCVVMVDTILKNKNSDKPSLLKLLWTCNFYATTVMVFLKYFYFLKIYDNTSSLISTMLDFMTQHKTFIGLDEINEQTSTGLALFQHFGYEAAFMIISWVNIYIMQFKIYETFRTIVMNENNQDLSSALMSENDHRESDEVSQKTLKNTIRNKNIHYFYHQFIRPVDVTAYLAKKQFKLFEKFLHDCFLDIALAITILAFSLEPKSIRFVLYFPLFAFLANGFYQRFVYGLTLQITKNTLTMCAGWSLIVLLTMYAQITINQLTQENINKSSALDQMFITYCLTLTLYFLYKIFSSCPERPQLENKPHIIISILLPFRIKSAVLWKQLLTIFGDFWLSITIALYITNIFSPNILSTFLHPITIAFALIKKMQNSSSDKWLYLTALVSLVDIWDEDFYAYLTIVSCTIYYATSDAINIKSAHPASQTSYSNFTILSHASQNQLLQKQVKKDKKQVQDQEKPENQQKNIEIEQQEQIKSNRQLQGTWKYYNSYCTIIWFFPIIIALIWLMGVIFLSPSVVATILILFSLGTLLYQLLFQTQVAISWPIFMVTISITSLFFLYEFTICIFIIFNHTNYQQYKHSWFGLLLIFSSCFFYMILSKKSSWYIHRGTHAKEYWQEKTDMVGELGSQLHNEKKLISLQTHYTSKERLLQKVQKISKHLRNNNARQSYYTSLDTLMRNNPDEEDAYQLSSNMLLFLPNDVLSECFYMLNQYISHSNHQNTNVIVLATNLRKSVLLHFPHNHSLYQTLIQVKKLEAPQQVGGSDDSSDQFKPNLQKIYQINMRYKQCYKILSDHTSQFGWFFKLIFQNFQIIAMIVVVGWNLFGGVYSIPANIAVFAWAVVLENKTTIFFWVFLMIYVCSVLIIKQILPLLPRYDFISFVFYYHSDDYLYEYFIILVSVMQTVLIKLGGTKQKTYSERQSIYDCFYRAALNRAANGTDMQKEEDFIRTYQNLIQPKTHSFLYRVFSKSRFKPGKDFYPLMSGIQLVILLYIFFFYDMMEFQSMKNRKSIGQILNVSQFSSHMIIALFMQIVIMIVDRLIVSLNLVDEANQTLQNFFLSFTFSTNNVKDPPKQLNRVGVFDFLLVLKYIFHVCLLILVNLFIYIFVPSGGLTKSLIPSCNQAECNKSYTYLSVFLILYFLYFLVSGLQIKHGFSRNKCKNVLMEKYHYINYYIYKAFTAIPFAWEFKKICDWTVTSTALPLFHWMKFQDINARMYQSKCEAEMIKLKPIGTPWNKYILGPAGFLSILLLVFSPFLIYSPVNPFSVSDSVIGSQLMLYLDMDGHYDYKIFSTSHTSLLKNIENEFQIDMTDRNLFMMGMSKYPDENFMLSEPAVNKLAYEINRSIASNKHIFQLVLSLTIIQQEGGESVVQWAKKSLNKTQLKGLAQLIKLQNRSTLVIDNFYSPFPGQLPLQSIRLKTTLGQYYQLQIVKKDKSESGLYFYYLTTNKFKLSIGIVTFYLTYVLVISRLLRFYLTGTVRNIIYTGCDIEGLLVLCQAVREARIVENFKKEESFYFELVDMMRQPNILKKITGSFVEFRKNHL